MNTPNKQQIQTEIAKLQEKLKVIEAKEKEQDLVYIKELKIYVEKNLHTEMNKVSLIVIPQGYRLLELSELIFIYNNYQDKFNWGEDKFFDEITKQPIKNCKYPYWNAWLHGLGGGFQSDLNGGNRYLSFGNAVRGVRFVREVKE